MAEKTDNKRLEDFKRRVLAHWQSFNLFAFFGLFVFSYFYFFEHNILSILLIVVFIPFVIINFAKSEVAEKNPESFIATEDFNKIISRILWRFIYPAGLTIIAVFLILNAKYPVISKQVSPLLGPLSVVFLTAFGATLIYVTLAVGNAKQRPWLLKVRAKAYFQVIAMTVNDPVKKFKHPKIRRFFGIEESKEINDNKRIILMFERGISDLNTLFISRFNCEICNREKLCNYFRFVVWSKDSREMGRILGITQTLQDNLTYKLEFSTLLRTTNMLSLNGEAMNDKELFESIDFKTGIGRWYSHNKESVQLSLLIIPIIVSLIALIMPFVH
jgi:hypothetical protein